MEFLWVFWALSGISGGKVKNLKIPWGSPKKYVLNPQPPPPPPPPPVSFFSWIAQSVKGCVCYFFASLFVKPKGQHLWSKEKCFSFHFISLSQTWEVNTVWQWNLASLCNITEEKFWSKNSMKNVNWKLVPGPF